MADDFQFGKPHFDMLLEAVESIRGYPVKLEEIVCSMRVKREVEGHKMLVVESCNLCDFIPNLATAKWPPNVYNFQKLLQWVDRTSGRRNTKYISFFAADDDTVLTAVGSQPALTGYLRRVATGEIPLSIDIDGNPTLRVLNPNTRVRGETGTPPSATTGASAKPPAGTGSSSKSPTGASADLRANGSGSKQPIISQLVRKATGGFLTPVSTRLGATPGTSSSPSSPGGIRRTSLSLFGGRAGNAKGKEPAGKEVADGLADEEQGEEEQGEEEQGEEEEGEEEEAQRLAVDVITLIGSKNTHDDDATWLQVCQLLRCLPDAKQIHVPGLLYPLDPYQAVCVFFLLTRYSKHNTAAAIIADDVGLGKTYEVIASSVIFHLFHENFAEVAKEWSAMITRGRKRNHLPKNSPHTVCPTEGSRGFQCCCVKDSITLGIVVQLADFPSLFICPQNLLENFAQQWSKFVDLSQDSPAKDMKLFVDHAEFKNHGDKTLKKYYKSRVDWIKVIYDGAKHEWLEGGRQPVYELVKVPRGSRYMVATSSDSRSLTATEKASKAAIPYFGAKHVSHRNTSVPYHKIAFSFCYFEEAHRYKGDQAANTGPFRFFDEIAKANKFATMSIAVTASAMLAGPRLWGRLMQNVYMQQARRNLTLPFNAASSEALDTAATDFAYIEGALAGGEQAQYSKDFETRVTRLRPLLEELLKYVIIRRERDDLFRGQKMVDFEEVEDIRTEKIELDSRTSRRVKDINREIHQNLVENHAKNNEEPRTTVMRCLETASKYTTDVLIKNMDETLWIAAKASVFPNLIDLYNRGVLVADDFTNDKVNKEADKVTRALLNTIPVPGDVEDAFSKSKFWKYRTTLQGTSPKLNAIQHVLDRLLELRESETIATAEELPGPADGSNVRHLIIFTEHALSAFLLLMTLWELYRGEDVDFYLIHSAMPAHPKASQPMNGRTSIAKMMQEDMQPGGKCKVLISTSTLSAEGYNLYRANYMIFADIHKKRDRDQCMGRIVRRGQTMKPRILQLYDPSNVVDLQRLALLDHSKRFELLEDGTIERAVEPAGADNPIDLTADTPPSRETTSDSLSSGD